MAKKLSIIYIVLFIGVFNTLLYSNNIRTISASDGLPHNRVNTILQDSLGFMWFGTASGLCRYDGYELLVFDYFNLGLSNCRIKHLYQANDTTMYIGTADGLYAMNLTNYTVYPVDLKQKPLNVTRVVNDKKKGIWIASWGQGVFYMNDTVTTHYKEGELISDMKYDNEGSLCIVSKDRGLFYFDNKTKSFERKRRHFPLANTYLHQSTGDFWIGTVNGVLFHISPDKKIQRHNLPTKKLLKRFILNHIVEKDSVLLLGTTDGLYEYHIPTNHFVQNTYYHNTHDPLVSKELYSLFMDNEGGTWVGTGFEGVCYIPASGKKVESFMPEPEKNSIHGSVISSFCEINDSTLLIGSRDKGLSVYHKHSKTFTRLKGYRNEIYGDINTLHLDGDKLWVGTYGNGIDVFNLQTGEIDASYEDKSNPNSVFGNYIPKFLQNNNDTIWCATNWGLCYYSKKNGHFERIPQTKGIWIEDMIFDHKGYLWLASVKHGLARYNPTTDEYTTYSESNHKLPINNFQCLATDEKGNIWAGSEGYGIFKYNPQNNEFTHYGIDEGLSGKVIFSIESAGGYLWIGAANGLIKYNPENRTSTVYTKENGLPSDYFNTNASFKTASGDLLFGTSKGFIQFNPEQIYQNTFIPKATISTFSVEDKQTGEKKIWHSPQAHRPPEFSSHYNSVSISFSALSFNQPGANKYKYQLEGYESKPNGPVTQHVAEYANLPQGKYRFVVYASNDDLVWSEKPAIITFEILPPYWKSKTAYLIYALALLLITLLIYQVIKRRLKAKQTYQIEQLNIKKERELNRFKINFFTNLAHEIKTPVTLIKTPLELLLNAEDISTKTKKDLEAMSKNTNRLVNLINELLEFRKMEDIKYQLRIGRQDLVKLLHDIYERFMPFAQSKRIDFQLVTPFESLFVDVDSEAVVKATSNLLTNAFKFATSSIRLALSLTKNENTFTISVEDDGSGIPEEKLKDIFEPFNQLDKKETFQGVGLGLPFSKALIELHGGTLQIKSQSEKGTIAIIELKFPNQSALEETESVHAKTDEEKHLSVINSADSTVTDTKKADQISIDKDAQILIVEDNDELGNYLHSIFRNNYHVLLAPNGKKALEIIEASKEDPALIISDIMMPEMDGIELCNLIKTSEKYSHIPILLLTAKSSNRDKVEGLVAGADAYIPKPFDINYLKVQVQNIIDNRQRIYGRFRSEPFYSIHKITSQQKDSDLLNEVERIIIEHLEDDITVESLSEELSISRYAFYKKIKALTGQSPQDYIRIIRLRLAAGLLSKKELSIKEIAFKTGFNSVSYFSKSFKKQFGKSPSEF